MQGSAPDKGQDVCQTSRVLSAAISLR